MNATNLDWTDGTSPTNDSDEMRLIRQRQANYTFGSSEVNFFHLDDQDKWRDQSPDNRYWVLFLDSSPTDQTRSDGVYFLTASQFSHAHAVKDSSDDNPPFQTRL